MNVLVIGGGGREHAICWKLSRSKKVDKIYCIPGNAGIGEIAECHGELSAIDIDGIMEFTLLHSDIGMVMVAPDDPLALGLVNRLEEAGVRAFGPRREAAVIEASKAFSKDLMKKYHIPTADYAVFERYEAAKAYLTNLTQYPVVVKADGLALGKGVIICENEQAAQKALTDIMCDRAFGTAGNQIVIEEFLTGREVSVLCFTDGKTILPMASSQDHKRALDNDGGLNTGGMGTFSPSKFYTAEMAAYVQSNILEPTVAAMNSEGRTFKGVLYVGLMITNTGIKVLEYNARFGDPETQVLLPRLKNDLAEVFNAVIDGRLDQITLEWDERECVCVIMASGGYPEKYSKGEKITIGAIDPGVLLFHAGTALKGGELVTNGGRVLGVAALGKDIEQARAAAYGNVEKIHFAKAHYRRDIGYKL